MAGIFKAIGAVCTMCICVSAEASDGLVDAVKGVRRFGRTTGGSLITAAGTAAKSVEVISSEVLNERILEYATSAPPVAEMEAAVAAIEASKRFIAALD